ncbi:MAG: Deoxyribodipyrimidine photo-lyase [Rhizobium sp.]|nr:Deoxyribodipyrimidine photo-lyase [Rhizobium sp.]
MPEYDAAAVITWFRNDLRLHDNLALQAAIATQRPVICIYIREDGAPLAGALGAAQGWWLHHSLMALDRSLQATGNRLVLLSGDPRFVIEHLIETASAKSVFWNRRYDQAGIRMDTEIKSLLGDRGIHVRSFAGFLMHEPSKLVTKQGKPFQVFTPFWKAFEARFHPSDPLPAPARIPTPENLPDGENLADWTLSPQKPDWAKGFGDIWRPGELGALARLDTFLAETIEGYKKNRDIPSAGATSGLSPHLAMGEISPHRIWHATRIASGRHFDQDVAHFRRELVWREFSWSLLFHRPDMATVNMDRRFDAFPWSGDSSTLGKWKRGQTGYPIVDAGMRELWQTGFMQNRVRMITASFLIKDLLIDWREGECWFRDTLVDIDRASNAMNWQWVAGCGVDASPWFRIFNPVKQGETFDPDGTYVRRYCPELEHLPDQYVHRPFDAPTSVLQKAGVIPGKTYPRPVVAHDLARDRALEAFRSIRTTDS